MGQGRDIRWRRLTEVFSELESRPASRFLFQACARLFRLRLRAGRRIRRLFPGKQHVFPSRLSALDVSRGMRVLIIAEDRIPQCYRYRVQQKLQQLVQVGIDASAIPWTEAVNQPDPAHYYHVVLFYRVPGYAPALDLIGRIRAAGKLVFYETDDIIFDADIQKTIIESSHRQISSRLRKQVLNGAKYYRAAMEACALGIASTPALAEQMERVMGKGAVFVHPNGLDELSYAVADGDVVRRDDNEIRLFYGSGTRTHDADLALIASPLAAVMAKYPHVRLALAGHISLPEQLAPFEQRVYRLPLLDAEDYLSVLRYADINLAPLVAGVFADSKSEIKWLEAAILGVPTIASATRSFEEAVTQAKTGCLAASEQDWMAHLTDLVANEAVRKRLGKAAKQAAAVKYRPADLGKKLAKNMLAAATRAGAVTKAAEKTVCVLGDRQRFDASGALATLREAFSVVFPTASDKENPGEFLRYAKPHLILFADLPSDDEVTAVQASGIAHAVLFSDAAWMAGSAADNVGNKSVFTSDLIKLSSSVDDMNGLLKARKQLRRLAETASLMMAVSNEVALLYESSGIPCETLSAIKLASVMKSSDKAR